jgi:hypothetical protein
MPVLFKFWIVTPRLEKLHLLGWLSGIKKKTANRQTTTIQHASVRLDAIN